MFRNLLISLSVVAVSAIGIQLPHKVFRIIPETINQLESLHTAYSNAQGFDFWRGPSYVSNPVDLMVAPEKLDEFVDHMKSLRIKYSTIVEDVEAKVAATATRAGRSSRTLAPPPRTSSFGWTSYHNLEEIYSFLESMEKTYPDKVQVIVGGKTYEDRQIKGVKISFGQNKPGIFIEGGSHAREWISHATVTYLINQLLTSTDSEVKQLAEAHDWYIFPVFNPDGYAYTHIDPANSDYRLWRKTRSPSRGSFGLKPSPCNGTDMNRNWDANFGTAGASFNPCADGFSNYMPFSEIETKTLSEYISSLSGKLFAYISFHSYSQYLMFPYGHTKDHLDNYDEQLAVGKAAIAALSKRYGTQYKTGNIAEVIGLIAGTSLDWVKANLKLPLVYIYELRDTGDHAFLLPPNQIIPTGEEVVDSLVALFKEANKLGYYKYKMMSESTSDMHDMDFVPLKP